MRKSPAPPSANNAVLPCAGTQLTMSDALYGDIIYALDRICTDQDGRDCLNALKRLTFRILNEGVSP